MRCPYEEVALELESLAAVLRAGSDENWFVPDELRSLARRLEDLEDRGAVILYLQEYRQ